MSKKFYITTPIYYVNDKPHIGHAYTTIAADILARYYRSQNYEVFFLTGTDEHGQKIMEAAQKRGLTPQQHVDDVVQEYIEIWKYLNVKYDYFIRTTYDFHEETVKKILQKLIEQGDIYKGKYQGYYCTPCETFLTKTQLVDGKCPQCHRDVITVEEENYFFKLSKYAPLVLEHIKKNPGFVSPKIRENEIISRLEKEEIKDVSISRSSFDWGVNFPGDSEHVVYVWIDALINYISAIGYERDTDKFQKWWPAEVHLMAKDIIWFHTVIWPSLLLALGIELPQKCFVHGFWNSEGKKMSKSIGNVINPREICDKYGVDSFRFYLFREVPFGNDGNFVMDNFKLRYKGDLANDLGNLLNRTINMGIKYLKGIVKKVELKNSLDTDIIQSLTELENFIQVKMAELDFSSILTETWKVISSLNKYIDTVAPWSLNKEGKTKRLEEVFFTLTYAFQKIAFFIAPFMPETSEKIIKMIGLSEKELKVENFSASYPEYKLEKGGILFPKVED